MSGRLILGVLLAAGIAGCTGPLVYHAPVKKVKPIETTATVVGKPVQVPLPPMPDRATNNSTLVGIDTTGIGIRDDVHVWIFTDYTTAAKRKVLVTMGKNLQDLLAHPPKTTEEAKTLNQSYLGAVSGLSGIPGVSRSEAEEIENRLYLHTVNTPKRLDLYLRYNYLLNEKK